MRVWEVEKERKKNFLSHKQTSWQCIIVCSHHYDAERAFNVFLAVAVTLGLNQSIGSLQERRERKDDAEGFAQLGLPTVDQKI